MKKLLIVHGALALLLAGMEFVVPATADAASARSPASGKRTDGGRSADGVSARSAASARTTASDKRPDTGRRTHPPGKKAYSLKLTPRKSAANQGKRQSRQQEGKSATSKRNAGTFQPVAVTWRDARRHERQAASGSGASVQRRSRGGRSVTFRDQRGSVASDVAPRLQRGADGVARQPSR